METKETNDSSDMPPGYEMEDIKNYPMMNLKNFLDSNSNESQLHYVFVCGKGGVGKTTISCSIATELASETYKKRVLLVSTDPAHNLQDFFGVSVAPGECKRLSFDDKGEFKEAQENDDEKKPMLAILEVSPLMKKEKNGTQKQSFEQVLNMLGMGNLSETFENMPGIDEAMALVEVLTRAANVNANVVVFDTAPTGHTLRLLSFPKILTNMMSNNSMLKGMMNLFEPASNSPESSSSGRGSLSDRMDQSRKLISQLVEDLQNAHKTAFVCVTLAEKLPLYETERLIMEIMNRGMNVSNIVVNQLAPKPEEGKPCAYCEERYNKHLKYVKLIHEMYVGNDTKEEDLLFKVTYVKAQSDEVGRAQLADFRKKNLFFPERTPGKKINGND